MNRESGIDADLVGIFAKKSGTDTMESPGPAERVGHDAGIRAQDLAGDPLDAFGHLRRSAPRERHQEDPPRVGATHDQMGHTMRKRVRLAGPSARDDQQGSPDMTIGADAVLDGATLLWIEGFEI